MMMKLNRNQMLLLQCYNDAGKQETDAVATMMEVNRKQMLDAGKQETDAVATMMQVNRKQMLLLP